ncbi:hypothetical protein BCR34DRAFT_583670 [Clohesyomyces aquaticus]|uniref:Uncharacterized protein n=1 Tax=Clohesyomyces aquaticus TaxID=1231657 RepID=A0A1Y2A4T8_9PLEO|nr:hypothetical protein BCR34DRAFT_583670 [Clohesyomyces aquaticus]
MSVVYLGSELSQLFQRERKLYHPSKRACVNVLHITHIKHPSLTLLRLVESPPQPSLPLPPLLQNNPISLIAPPTLCGRRQRHSPTSRANGAHAWYGYGSASFQWDQDAQKGNIDFYPCKGKTGKCVQCNFVQWDDTLPVKRVWTQFRRAIDVGRRDPLGYNEHGKEKARHW